MNPKPKYRHELKYEITYREYLSLKMKLQPVMKLDPHAGPDGTYQITSLYFDNFSDKALREKLDGVNIRDKYRIRFYDQNSSRLTLEKKSKHNNLCLKTSCPITVTEGRRILEGDLHWVQTDSRETLQDFYQTYHTQFMRPKTIVSYRRFPLIYEPGNVRVTFDMDIRSGLSHTDLFDLSYPLIEAFPGRIILEVKYDEYLPDIIRLLLQSQTPRVGAFSKYAACRKYE